MGLVMVLAADREEEQQGDESNASDKPRDYDLPEEIRWISHDLAKMPVGSVGGKENRSVFVPEVEASRGPALPLAAYLVRRGRDSGSSIP